MDDLVIAALKKWPNVPDCHGWLALDARGDWYLRDDRVRQAGPFPTVKGSRLDHEKLREFIGRNYEAGDDGAWYFQNGPQRVYVELEAAPWVLRLQPDGTVQTHTGRPVRLRSTWLDEQGRLYADTDAGLGLVHPQDMVDAAERLERGQWPTPQDIPSQALEARFGYRRQPAAG